MAKCNMIPQTSILCWVTTDKILPVWQQWDMFTWFNMLLHKKEAFGIMLSKIYIPLASSVVLVIRCYWTKMCSTPPFMDRLWKTPLPLWMHLVLSSCSSINSSHAPCLSLVNLKIWVVQRYCTIVRLIASSDMQHHYLYPFACWPWTFCAKMDDLARASATLTLCTFLLLILA